MHSLEPSLCSFLLSRAFSILASALFFPVLWSESSTHPLLSKFPTLSRQRLAPAPLPCTATWKHGPGSVLGTCRAHLIFFPFSRTPALHCLAHCLKTISSYILSFYLVV